jgi:L-amino acid N-acyltransferase YncA
MIVSPSTPQQWQALAAILHERAGVHPSADLRMLGWVSDNELKMVVGFNAFIGKTCQMHVAMAEGFTFTPKAMLRACFDYAFNQAGCAMVLGVVNSQNEAAMRYDLHLGFKTLYALAGMHDEGGDIVLLGMTREECRFLEGAEDEREAAVLH